MKLKNYFLNRACFVGGLLLSMAGITAQAQYCEPVSSSPQSSFINDFSTSGGVTNISNLNSGSHNNTLVTGQAHSGYKGDMVTFSYSMSQSLAVNVNVDWNQDMDFDDPGEKIVGVGYPTSPIGSGTFVIPATAAMGTTRMRINASWVPVGQTNYGPCTNYLGEYEDYNITVLSCMTPGVTEASVSSLCSPATTLLSVSGNSGTVTYQWQSSANNTTYSNIQGATNATYEAAPTTSIYYRCAQTCGLQTEYSAPKHIIAGLSDAATVTLSADDADGLVSGGQLISFNATPFNGGDAPQYEWYVNGAAQNHNSAQFSYTALMGNATVGVKLTSNAACTASPVATDDIDLIVQYCPPPMSYCGDAHRISGVTFADMSATGTCGPNGYADFTSAVGNVVRGQAYTLGVNASNNFPVAAWIDFNHNLSFEADEFTDLGAATAGYASTTITVPASAQLGTTRMRVRAQAVAGGSFSSGNACGSLYGNVGETEDYTVNILPPTCSGTPVAGTASITGGGQVCNSDDIELQLNGYTVDSSVTVQWQISPGGTTWWNLGTPSANGSYTFENVDYPWPIRAAVTCQVTHQTVYSNVVNVALTTPGPASVSLATDDANGIIFIGQLVNFTATPVKGGNAPQYEWYVNGVAQNHNSSTFSYTFSDQAAEISVQLTSNLACATTPTATASMTVTPIPTSYCTPQASNCNSEAGVIGVEFADIYSFGTCGPNGYADFTSVTGNLVRGLTYPIKVHAAQGVPVAVWIDFNHDFVFNASEYITAGFASSGFASATITIPSTMALGKTRMRVRAQSAQGFHFSHTNSCGGMISNTGETEDYTLNILPPTCSGTPVAGTASILSGAEFCSPGPGTAELQLSGYTIDSAVTVQWQISPDNGTATWWNVGSTTQNGAYTMENLNQSWPIRAAVTCHVTSQTTYSNVVNVAMVDSKTPAVALSLNDDDGIAVFGQLASFTATPTFGGASPQYEWYVDGVAQGVNSNQFSYELSDTVTIGVRLTSALLCATTPTATNSLTVKPVPPFYCIPPTSVCGDAARISSVLFADLAVYGTCGPNGYADFTSATGNVVQGHSYTLSVNASNDFAVGAWIDFNHNLSFEISEFTNLGIASSGNTTAAISIPVTAVPGATRMRVRAQHNGGGQFNGSNTCGALFGNVGETEDYTINILPPTCNSAPVAGTASITGGGQVCNSGDIELQLNGYTVDSSVTVQWQISPDNGVNTWWNLGNPSTNGSYTFENVDYPWPIRAAVTCHVTAQTVYSNVVNVTVLTTPASPSVSISSDDADGFIISTQLINFTAHPFNGGDNPQYEWYVDGVAQGVSSSNFSYTLPAPAVISVQLTSNAACATTPLATGTKAITYPPQCTGAPVAGTASAMGATSFCGVSNAQLSLAGYSVNLGLGFQWQSSENGGSTWADISGATDDNYHANTQTVSTLIRAAVTCTNSSQTSYSNAVALTVTPYYTPAVSVQPPAAFCHLQPVALTAAGTDAGTAPVYTWYRDGVEVEGEAAAIYTSNTYSKNEAEEVYVVVSEINNPCALETTATSDVIDIQPVPAPDPNTTFTTASGSTRLCEGDAVTFTSKSASLPNAVFSWAIDDVPVPGQTGSSFTTAQAGEITATVTSQEGCTRSASRTINSFPTAIATALSNPAICPGASVTLEAAPVANATYRWKQDETSRGATQTQVAKTAGAYSVTVTRYGCSATSATVNVSIKTPDVTVTPLGPTSVCTPDAVTLTAMPHAGYSYTWYKTTTPVGNSSNYTATASGSYYLGIAFDGCPEKKSAAIPVLVTPTPAASISFVTKKPTYWTLRAYPTTTGHSYQWYKDGSMLTDSVRRDLVATVNGNYTVVVSKGGCTATSAIFPVNSTTFPTPATPGARMVAAIGEDEAVINIFPNPSTGIFNIGSEQPVNVIVKDVQGRIVMSVRDASSVDLGNQPAGMYIFSITDADGKLLQVERVVKQ